MRIVSVLLLLVTAGFVLAAIWIDEHEKDLFNTGMVFLCLNIGLNVINPGVLFEEFKK